MEKGKYNTMIKELLEYIRYEMTDTAKFKFEIAIWILLFGTYGGFLVYYWRIYQTERNQIEQQIKENREIMLETIENIGKRTQDADIVDNPRMIFRQSLTNKPSQ